MKKIQILIMMVVACVGLMSCSQRLHEGTAGQAGRADKIVAALHDASTRYVVVVAHRGDWRNYPENSIPAIESVIRMGVDVMELDVKMTRDSVLVLSHDWTLNRTTTGSGNISDYTYEQLLAFDLKRGHGIAIPGLKIPTLRQALEVCKDRIVVNVDQGFDYYDQVLAITEDLGMTDQVLIKNGQPLDKVQQRMSRHAHKMMYMPVVSVTGGSDMSTFNSYLANPEAVPIAFELCFDTLDDNVKNTARRVLDAGSKVWVNTIWGSLCGDHDDDRAYDSLDPDKIYGPILDLGTSIIQTDRPEFLIKYLEKKGRRRF
jgi:glycerophosphoryl diester phosphodiesterase